MRLSPGLFHSGVHHDTHQIFKTYCGLPTQFGFGFARIAQQEVHLSWPMIATIDFDVFLPIQPGVVNRRSGDISGILGNIKAHSDVTLRGELVNFLGLDAIEEFYEIR